MLPQRGNGLDTLKLVGLLSLVAEDGELIAAHVTLADKLVEKNLLQEVRLYIIGADRVGDSDLLVEVIEPPDHLGDRALPDESGEAMEVSPGLAPKFNGLVVVSGGRLKGGVAVADEIVIAGKREGSAISYPIIAEDRSLGDGIVHQFALERDVTHKRFLLAYLLDSPFSRPRWFAVAVYGVDFGNDHALGGHKIGEDGIFTDKITDHTETATATVESAEKCLLDPLGETGDTVGIVDKLVIVKVIYNDIVRAAAFVAETTRRLAATACEKGAAVGSNELARFPRTHHFLSAEIGNVALVELQLRLNVAEEGFCVLLALADKHHKVHFF